MFITYEYFVFLSVSGGTTRVPSCFARCTILQIQASMFVMIGLQRNYHEMISRILNESRSTRRRFVRSSLRNRLVQKLYIYKRRNIDLRSLHDLFLAHPNLSIFAPREKHYSGTCSMEICEF